MTRNSLSDIISELKQLSGARRTGVLRIVTDQNHTAAVGLEGGRIVALRYRIKRGADAIALLKEINTGQYTFDEQEKPGDERALLPPHEEILEQLGGGVQVGAQTDFVQAGPVQADAPPPAAPPSNSDVPISPTAKAVLESALAEHIGPMAGIVCRNVFANATTLSAAVAAMASKILDAERAGRFEREVQRRLA